MKRFFRLVLFAMGTLFMILVAALFSYASFGKGEQMDYDDERLAKISSSSAGIVIEPMHPETGMTYAGGEYSISGTRVKFKLYKKIRIVVPYFGGLLNTERIAGRFQQLKIPLDPGKYELYYENPDGTAVRMQEVEIR